MRRAVSIQNQSALWTCCKDLVKSLASLADEGYGPEGFSSWKFHPEVKDELSRANVTEPHLFKLITFCMLKYFKKFMKVALIFDWELYMSHGHMLVYFNFDILLKIIFGVFLISISHKKINLAWKKEECWQSWRLFHSQVYNNAALLVGGGVSGIYGALFLQIFK